MLLPRIVPRALATVALLLGASGCNRPTTKAATVNAPTTTALTTAPPSAPTALSVADAKPNVAGTWLFRCCDGSTTWIGMVTLVEDHGQLHGAWLTDGDSHGSYLEGRVDGARTQLSRRWRTGKVLHEQQYELTLDADGQHLNGTFREPAFEAASHTIALERGFVNEPRRVDTAPAAPVLTPAGTAQTSGLVRDPKRACDCALVCYCGGIPPGPEHYAEAARCGSSCSCRVCPPLP